MNKVRFGLDSYKVERRAITSADPLIICMPFPPSVNSMFGQAGGKQRYKSQAYKSWETATEWELSNKRLPRVPGPVHLLFEFEERDLRQRDVTNHLKAPEDMLVKLKIIDGDHSAIVRHVEAKWVKDVMGVRVTITPLARAA